MAGVELTDAGHVQVDDRLRRTNRRIYAAGDVTGRSAFTHLGGVHGGAAATEPSSEYAAPSTTPPFPG
jgi:pyruvate/2-oxoglutarate dehydrogenase complex dihydrolipoamide dehydrogenase (E3) component